MIYETFSNDIKILLVINEELNYNYAPAAKYLALNEELTKGGFDSMLIGRPSKRESINCKRNITTIKPKINPLFARFNEHTKERKL